jgi:hypothetical protein
MGKECSHTSFTKHVDSLLVLLMSESLPSIYSRLLLVPASKKETQQKKKTFHNPDVKPSTPKSEREIERKARHRLFFHIFFSPAWASFVIKRNEKKNEKDFSAVFW